MDITRGDFDEFTKKQSRPNTKQSLNNTSTTSSLEQLPADLTRKQTLHNYSDRSESDGCLSKTESNSSITEDDPIKTHPQNQNENANIHASFDETFETDPRIIKELKRIKKLDKILIEKTEKERTVKRQRFLYQKCIHTEFSDKSKDSNGTSYTDASSNLSKYLALLPPSQQLDILIERNEEINDLKPIFQTQYSFSSDHLDGNKENGLNPDQTQRPRSSHTTKERLLENNTPSNKPSSAGSKRHQNQEEKQDFIQRNIQLAKDAGSYVSMTDEEKKRLSLLLEDIDSLDEDTEGSTAFMKVVPLASGEGFMPESTEMERLEEINQKLQTLMGPSASNSISSTPRQTFSFHSNAMRDIGTKIAKSKLTEALDPEQRLLQIESRLSQLDTTWKENCNRHGPLLSENQLQILLDECSRPTSPSSCMTSILPEYEMSDFEESTYAPSVDSSRLSSQNSFRTYSDLNSHFGSAITTQSKLSRECLDRLLSEAKASLGLSDNYDASDENISITQEPISP